MRKFLMWFLLLNKRLYKKITFIIILALIPIAVVALSAVSKEGSGVVNIALASHGENDKLYYDVVSDLKKDNSLVYFIEYDSPTEAYKSVESGANDAAWIFNADLEQNISNFSESFDSRDSAVTVIVRESNVATHLTLEKLSGALYKHVSRNFYINYINEEVKELDNLSEEELFYYYDNFESDGKLFVFDNPAHTWSNNNSSSTYMTAPIRGLLAIISVICGFAAAMFYIDDEKKGTFSWVKQRNKIFVQFGCVAIAVLNVSIVMFASLFFAGVNVSLTRELLSLVIFVLCCSAFCVVVSQICTKVYILGCFIPILTVIMFVICPVFFDYGAFRSLQYIFPPTYYINSAYNNNYYLYAIAYFAVCAVVALVINAIKQRRIRIS